MSHPSKGAVPRTRRNSKWKKSESKNVYMVKGTLKPKTANREDKTRTISTRNITAKLKMGNHSALNRFGIGVRCLFRWG